MPLLNVQGDTLYLKCDYNQRDIAKTVPGAGWDPETKCWVYPRELKVLEDLRKAFSRLFYSPELLEWEKSAESTRVDTLELKGLEDAEIDWRDANRLFDFQRVGINFLSHVPRAILGDDMGLGKSLQAIVACEVTKARHILVVCPNSLKRNWQNELRKWLGDDVSVQLIEGDRTIRVQQIRDTSFKFSIINYEALRLHSEDLSRRTWDMILLDESHRVKSRSAQVTKAARQIVKHAKSVIAMSGTPIMNDVEELWVLLNLLYPQRFRSWWRFVDQYCEKTFNGFGWEVRGVRDVRGIRKILEPIMIRRLKTEVLKDLPPKTIQQVFVTLEGEQKRIYNEMEKRMFTEIDDSSGHISATVVIAQITRLKQIAIDPHLMLDDYSDIHGAKIDALLDILEGVGNEKVVIFTQFERAASRLFRRLSNLGYRSTLITGLVTGEARQLSVDTFQTDPDYRACICTTQTGGLGLNLTAGSIAVFMDKLWTPAANLQAQDRLSRIGQTKPVTIIELLVADSIESKIEKILDTKQSLFDDLIEGRTVLHAKEIINLLSKRGDDND